MKPQVKIRNNLAHLRLKRGFGATQLAAEVGISRQTIYAIENGSYVPNTAVSLQMAHVLEVRVEELFQVERKSLLLRLQMPCFWAILS